MAEETDGVREAFDDALRIALTVATQLGERVARLHEQFARQREAGSAQTNRELETRFEAERGAMRASLLPLKQASWWQHATVADIANARETARVWSDYDQIARDTNNSIQREVHERYGIDVNRPGAEPAKVAKALRIAENERAQAVIGRGRDRDQLEAGEMLLLEADRRDRVAAEVPNDERAQKPDYDSPRRRGEFAASLAGVVSAETIAARILADGENARHPREAVLSQRASVAKLERGASTKVQRRDRGGISGR